MKCILDTLGSISFSVFSLTNPRCWPNICEGQDMFQTELISVLFTFALSLKQYFGAVCLFFLEAILRCDSVN